MARGRREEGETKEPVGAEPLPFYPAVKKHGKGGNS